MFIPTTAQQQKDNFSRFVVVKLMLNVKNAQLAKTIYTFYTAHKRKEKTSAAILNKKVCRIK
jgi:hypothetical protein